MVKRHFRRAGSGREALQEGREWLGGLTGGLGVVERPARRAGSGQKAFCRTGSGQEALPEGRKRSDTVPEDRQTPSKGWKVLREIRESLPDAREWSEVPPGGTAVVVRLSRRARSGR